MNGKERQKVKIMEDHQMLWCLQSAADPVFGVRGGSRFLWGSGVKKGDGLELAMLVQMRYSPKL